MLFYARRKLGIKMINLGKLSPNGKEVILKEMDNGCVECISHSKDNCGYTRIFANGKQERLFRYLYKQKYGEIPKGMVIRHKCDNSSCCNIKHLEIGTQLDNVKDMIIRNRVHKGSNNKIKGVKNGANKLTEQQVIEIYTSTSSYEKLSKKYNVSSTNIFLIKKKKQWKWLTDKIKEVNYEKNMHI